MKTKEEKNIILLNTIALIIATLTIPPYNLKSVILVEVILKFLVYPLVIVFLTVYPFILRFRKLKRDNAKEVVITTVPFLTYFSCACFYLSFLSARYQIGKNNAFGDVAWVISLAVYLFVGMFFVLLNLYTRYNKKKDANKQDAVIKTVLLSATLLFVMLFGLIKTYKYTKEEYIGKFISFSSPVLTLSCFTMFFVILFSLLSSFVFFKNVGLKEQSLVEYERIYNKIEDDRLFALMQYAEIKLSKKGYVIKRSELYSPFAEEVAKSEEDAKPKRESFFKSLFKKKAKPKEKESSKEKQRSKLS